ncbi:MAG: septum formation initiator family protein [Bacteroidetes bacterium]|nr:septum formation initiator family protein [Bacteroidota bacterium]
MLKKTLPYIKNKYTLTLLAFVVWVSFFDKNDLLSQMELRKEVKKLEGEKNYFVTEIGKNKSDMKDLMTNPKNLEKFAREKYLMKKDNEDVFVLVKGQGTSERDE